MYLELDNHYGAFSTLIQRLIVVHTCKLDDLRTLFTIVGCLPHEVVDQICNFGPGHIVEGTLIAIYGTADIYQGRI